MGTRMGTGIQMHAPTLIDACMNAVMLVDKLLVDVHRHLVHQQLVYQQVRYMYLAIQHVTARSDRLVWPYNSILLAPHLLKHILYS